jgi:hypothetical protein
MDTLPPGMLTRDEKSACQHHALRREGHVMPCNLGRKVVGVYSATCHYCGAMQCHETIMRSYISSNPAMSLSANIRLKVASWLPRPALRSDVREKKRTDIRQIVLVGRHPNPTADYYFTARLSAVGMPPHRFVDIAGADIDTVDPQGAFVVICRYASKRVLDWIETNAVGLAGVGLFIDDDIPSVITSSEAAWSYKLRLLFQALRPLPRLNAHLDVVWTSTPSLARTIAEASPIVLPPAPPRSLWDVPFETPPELRQGVVVAYHATAIHVQEHGFLKSVLSEVLAARPQVEFEVFATGPTHKIWQGMDRVTIRQPVSWTRYLSEASARQIDIMLVPLTPSIINDSRSATKRIDVARVGAAGIFSASHAYGQPDDSGEIRLDYDQKQWRDAILDLVDQPLKRQAAMAATRSIVNTMSDVAQAGLDIFPHQGR